MGFSILGFFRGFEGSTRASGCGFLQWSLEIDCVLEVRGVFGAFFGMSRFLLVCRVVGSRVVFLECGV